MPYSQVPAANCPGTGRKQKGSIPDNMKQQANKIRVALLFGSCSSEHEVSCVSAAAWADALATMPDRYEVILVGITKQGRWLKYSGSTEGMRSGSWEQDASCVPCVLSPDRSDHGLLVHSAIAPVFLPQIGQIFANKGVEMRCDTGSTASPPAPVVRARMSRSSAAVG